MEKSVISQVIILNRSKKIWKKSLMIAIINIKYEQALSKTFNAKL